MAARFASWHHRYPTGPEATVEAADARTPPVARRVATASAGIGATPPSGHRGPTGSGWGSEVAALVEARAMALEAGVCGAAGVRPEDVRRLRWSRRALREAAA
jgi:hypothetical protein